MCTWLAASRPSAVCVVTGQTQFQKRKRARELSDCPQYAIAENGNPLPTTCIPSTRILPSAQFCQSPYLIFLRIGVFRRVRTKATISFVISACPSVRPHGTTRLPRDGFSLNLMRVFFEILSRKFNH